MSAATKELPEGVSFLDLPDDELANYSPGAVEAPKPADSSEGEGAQASAEGAAAEGAVTPPVGEGAAADEGAEEEEKGTKAEPDATGKEPGKEAAEGAEGDAAAADAAKAPAKEETPPKADEKKVEKAADAIDYKAAYEQLLAPFKANGRDIQVQNVDEAITLMQMGANYNKKMAGLKPSLTLLKLLETNGLLSEEKISYLIDLDKKNPAAINKLVSESGLDPMDLDAKKAEGYKPTERKVDAREVELDEVMDEIQTTPSFQRTLEIVGKSWDAASRQAVADAPQVLKVINSHVQAGIYDRVSAQVDRERLFGRLNGLSDIEAYRQVGDAMAARGEFNSLGRQEQPKPTEKVIVQPKPPKADDEELKNKKRAASPSKPGAPAAPAPDFNPLALSDEEFLKVGKGKF